MFMARETPLCCFWVLRPVHGHELNFFDREERVEKKRGWAREHAVR